MKKVYILEGLECANCAAKIEKKVSELPGVASANVNFLTTKLTLEADESVLPDLLKQIQKIVRKTEPDTKVKEA